MRSYRDDPEYQRLYFSWIEARKLITPLIQQQTVIRVLLKFETDPEMITQLRRDLMNNRKGKNGLRSLNKRIHTYYKYCENKGIFPY